LGLSGRKYSVAFWKFQSLAMTENFQKCFFGWFLKMQCSLFFVLIIIVDIFFQKKNFSCL
jgi:hypothetical protein